VSPSGLALRLQLHMLAVCAVCTAKFVCKSVRQLVDTFALNSLNIFAIGNSYTCALDNSYTCALDNPYTCALDSLFTFVSKRS